MQEDRSRPDDAGVQPLCQAPCPWGSSRAVGNVPITVLCARTVGHSGPHWASSGEVWGRRTNADKRRAVEMLLKNEECGGWADRKIAEACGVSHPFVSKMRSEIGGSDCCPTIREGRDGRSVNVGDRVRRLQKEEPTEKERRLEEIKQREQEALQPKEYTPELEPEIQELQEQVAQLEKDSEASKTFHEWTSDQLACQQQALNSAVEDMRNHADRWVAGYNDLESHSTEHAVLVERIANLEQAVTRMAFDSADFQCDGCAHDKIFAARGVACCWFPGDPEVGRCMHYLASKGLVDQRMSDENFKVEDSGPQKSSEEVLQGRVDRLETGVRVLEGCVANRDLRIEQIEKRLLKFETEFCMVQNQGDVLTQRVEGLEKDRT